jgi:threonine/homoserine/homoserine lactone efflux protein
VLAEMAAFAAFVVLLTIAPGLDTAFVVRRAARWLARPVIKRRLDQLTGVVFVAFGLRLSLARPGR